MRRSRLGSPFALGLDMWALGMDSAMVIGLRTLKLAAGDAEARRESQRMVTEKLQAAAELPMVLASSSAATPDALTRKAVRHYARTVRANRKRLSAKA